MDLATITALAGGGTLTAFSAAVWVLLRLLKSTRKLLDESDERYRTERKDHQATSALLDAEEEKRRDLQNKLDDVSRELRALRERVDQQTVLIGQQTVQIGQQTTQIAEQTARIRQLETDVAQLTGASP